MQNACKTSKWMKGNGSSSMRLIDSRYNNNSMGDNFLLKFEASFHL